MPEYHYNIEQRSEAWHEARRGRFTGTDAALFLVAGKSADGIGAGLLELIYSKAAELITGYEKQHRESFAMAIGTEREPEAIAAYQETIFPETVTACGFVSAGNYFGFSPDGLVSKNGLTEVKCPQPPEYLRYIKQRSINPGYIAQMQWGLFLTGREYCDFITFNPDFADYPIDIRRMERDEKTIETFRKKAEAIEMAMDEILNWYSAKIEFG